MVDATFKGKVLKPGIVDAHTHVELQALIYSGHFVGQIPWPRVEGGFYPVYPSKVEVLNRPMDLDNWKGYKLREIMACWSKSMIPQLAMG